MNSNGQTKRQKEPVFPVRASRLLTPMDAAGRYPFVYTKAADTDLRATFARIRAEQEARKRDSKEAKWQKS
jgi:hypothetical protein